MVLVEVILSVCERKSCSVTNRSKSVSLSTSIHNAPAESVKIQATG